MSAFRGHIWDAWMCSRLCEDSVRIHPSEITEMSVG